MDIDLSYKKTDKHKLFKSLEENSAYGILTPQNYIPIYDCFFSLTQNNYNSITLNNKWQLHSITDQETSNIFKCVVKNDEKKETRKTYLKFSPLLDPSKYLLGKYDINDQKLFSLPSLAKSNCFPKVNDYNNSAYVDSFFTYLSSKLLHDHEFSHGLDFYGSFLAIKQDFRYNITDDLEYLEESNFFRKNDKILYELEDVAINEFDNDTRNYKTKLHFIEEDANVLHLSDITDLNDLDNIVASSSSSHELIASSSSHEHNLNEILSLNETIEINSLMPETKLGGGSCNSYSSSCSSRSSNTTISIVDTDTDVVGAPAESADSAEAHSAESATESNEEDEDYEDIDSDNSDDEESEIIAKIKNFPVQVISLEYCDNTLDDIMLKGNISDAEWESIVLQILFSLITFQNAFHLTHNDLHTNNVMYMETTKKFLYYKLNHVYYKVPTYGKLFKIIDFGRAIYKFRGQLLCSDSYHPEGDAATQYNCEPYFNDNKPRLEPNYSFDLCRLGCALYDYLIDEPKSKIKEIMLDWIKDDKGRNILYKKNGDERYPDFKLYKMIARTVNKHVPINVLSNTYFDKFIVPKKEITATMKLMDIDSIPSYVL